jgi:hypothetical protein
VTLPRAKRPQKAPPPDPTRATAQRWLPAADVSDSFIQRRDGTLVVALRIAPVAIALLSDREKVARIAAFHAAVNGLTDGFQIVSIPRPLDLDGYLRGLEDLLHTVDARRRRLLAQYLGYVRHTVAGGEALERRYYILLSGDGRRKGARDDLLRRAHDLRAALGRASLTATLCDTSELLDLIFVHLHPAQAATERATLPSPVTTYLPPDGGDNDADPDRRAHDASA